MMVFKEMHHKILCITFVSSVSKEITGTQLNASLKRVSLEMHKPLIQMHYNNIVYITGPNFIFPSVGKL